MHEGVLRLVGVNYAPIDRFRRVRAAHRLQVSSGASCSAAPSLTSRTRTRRRTPTSATTRRSSSSATPSSASSSATCSSAHFPTLDEGALSKMKAYLVSAPSLAAKARAVRHGRGDPPRRRRGEDRRPEERLPAGEPLRGDHRRRSISTAASSRRAQLIERSFQRRHPRASISRTSSSTTTRPRCRSSRRARAAAAGLQRRRRSRARSRQDLHRRGEGRQSHRARRRLVEERSAAAGGQAGAVPSYSARSSGVTCA